MSCDDHGHDPVAEFLDKPRKGGKTYRERFATVARLYLGFASVAADVKSSGLDPADIVKALTGVVLAVLVCQAPECVKDRDCAIWEIRHGEWLQTLALRLQG